MKAVSPSMKRAIVLARANGRKLKRYENTRWARRHQQSVAGEFGHHWFSDRTIQALVDRGLAEPTKWETTFLATRQPMEKTFPIEVTLTERAARVKV